MLFAAGLLLAGIAPDSGFAFPPPGVPSTINPGALLGSGFNSDAFFVFSDAGDTSGLNLVGFGSNPIFLNSAASPGDTVNLGPLSGPQVFGLDNLTTGTSFLANVPDPDGNFHAFYTTNYADFGVGALDPAVAAALAGLPAGTSVTFIGWEDLTAGQGSDWDYNDLIFAFSNLSVISTPEPTTLSLLSAGVIALGFLRRRKVGA
jgi:hypothetical protein